MSKTIKVDIKPDAYELLLCTMDSSGETARMRLFTSYSNATFSSQCILS